MQKYPSKMKNNNSFKPKGKSSTSKFIIRGLPPFEMLKDILQVEGKWHQIELYLREGMNSATNSKNVGKKLIFSI